MYSVKKELRSSPAIVEIYNLLKQIFKFTEPNIFILIMSAACIIIASFAQAVGIGLVIPLLNGLIDKSHFLGILNIPVLGNVIKNMPFVSSNISIFFVMMFLIMIAVYIENLAVYLSRILAIKVGTGVTYALRTKIFERYLKFEKAFYDRRKIGELNAIVTDDAIIGSCEQSILWLDRFLVTVVFSLTFLILMIIISWKLTLGVLVLLFPIYYFTQWISKKIHLSAKESFNERLRLAQKSWDTLSNIILVKLYGTEDKESKEFNGISSEFARHRLNIGKKQEAAPGVSDIINSTGVVLLVCISVILFLQKTYSLGGFLIYLVVLRRLAEHVKLITQMSAAFMNLPPQIEKLLWVFDDSDKFYITNGRVKFKSVKNDIIFKNVSFSYLKNMPALKNISFNVKKGEILAIVGPTGAGKTTIVNLLPRFYEYDSGAIEIDGTNIRELDIKSLRKKIGLVSQDVMVMNDTIRNNIVYGWEGDKVKAEELDRAARDAQIYDFIMSLPDKYDTFVGDRGIRLSGGEKQRISIARAILKNPDILILDEATSSLDTETEMLIQKALERLVEGKTVFAIAHRLSTIKNADRIIILENGEIKEQGTLQELLGKKGRFYYYWELQKLFY